MDMDIYRLVSLSEQPFDHLPIIYQAFAGLNAIHSQQIIHLDLKPENILINQDGYVKICDFGLAEKHGEDSITTMSSEIGCLWYRAPELHLKKKYGFGGLATTLLNLLCN